MASNKRGGLKKKKTSYPPDEALAPATHIDPLIEQQEEAIHSDLDTLAHTLSANSTTVNK
jgi:hypothetical protein